MEIRETQAFRDWFRNLRDGQARGRIADRLDRLAHGGHAGDEKTLGEGISELRLHFGPGYRVYLARRGGMLIVLLGGGDKDSQRRDIAKAKALAAQLQD